MIKRNYFKQTNHKNEQFLKQLIEKKTEWNLIYLMLLKLIQKLIEHYKK